MTKFNEILGDMITVWDHTAVYLYSPVNIMVDSSAILHLTYQVIGVIIEVIGVTNNFKCNLTFCPIYLWDRDQIIAITDSHKRVDNYIMIQF